MGPRSVRLWAFLLLTSSLLAVVCRASPLVVPKAGVFKKGEQIPQECCRAFCFPVEIGCFCCFENYDYFDGVETKHVDGVPDWLKKKSATSPQ
uniref:Secreted protein n=1 Tax=Steinernema glaseri TaxID=37863 RepID=A0A1I8A8M4_9BILA